MGVEERKLKLKRVERVIKAAMTLVEIGDIGETSEISSPITPERHHKGTKRVFLYFCSDMRWVLGSSQKTAFTARSKILVLSYRHFTENTPVMRMAVTYFSKTSKWTRRRC